MTGQMGTSRDLTLETIRKARRISRLTLSAGPSLVGFIDSYILPASIPCLSLFRVELDHVILLPTFVTITSVRKR